MSDVADRMRDYAGDDRDGLSFRIRAWADEVAELVADLTVARMERKGLRGAAKAASYAIAKGQPAVGRRILDDALDPETATGIALAALDGSEAPQPEPLTAEEAQTVLVELQASWGKVDQDARYSAIDKLRRIANQGEDDGNSFIPYGLQGEDA